MSDRITTEAELRKSVNPVCLTAMTANLIAQEPPCAATREPPEAAQAALERQIAQLRQRLECAERRAASEAAAHEDQAKLAKAMVRAARAEAREREALARANAELTALVRSMEGEVAALKAADAAAPRRTLDGEGETGGPAVVSGGATPSACGGGEPPLPLERKPASIPRIAVAGLCLAAVAVGAMLYPAVTSFLDDRTATLTSRVTVIDGDTIRIDGKTVRLLGIDAPPAATPAGKRATAYIRHLTTGQDVRCESNGRRVGDDILARCFIGSVDIGQVMLLSGNAVLRQEAMKGK